MPRESRDERTPASAPPVGVASAARALRPRPVPTADPHRSDAPASTHRAPTRTPTRTGDPRELLFLHQAPAAPARCDSGTRGAYRLVRTPPARVDPPRLDAAQRAVVDHAGGPLLVLAGPGTGKTTTLVEAVAARVGRGADPERILVLTFSRKAAVELRDRMALRLGGARAPAGHHLPLLLLRPGPRPPGRRPVRRAAAAAVRPRAGRRRPRAARRASSTWSAQGRAHVRWPDELRACLTTRGFADEVRAVLARSRELGLGPERPGAPSPRRIGRPDWRAAAAFLAEYLDVLDLQGVLDYAELVHRAVLLAERPEIAERLAAQYDAVFVDEYQDTDPAQVRLLRALAGGGRTLVAFGDPDQSIYAFRGADVNGILDFPDAFPRADGRPAPVAVLTHLPPLRRRPAGRHPPAHPAGCRCTRLPAEKVRAHRELAAVRDGRPGRGRTRTRRPAPSSTTSPTSCAAPTWRTASPGARWPSWSAPAAARSPRSAAPSPRPGVPLDDRRRRPPAAPRTGGGAAADGAARGGARRQTQPVGGAT